jgi:hypothetical protein
MVDMCNRIGAHFKKEVGALLPVLREIYRLIGLFQSDLTPPHNQQALLAQLVHIGQRLTFFEPLLHIRKHP